MTTLNDAMAVDPAVLAAAIAGSPKPAVRDLNGSGLLAVYTRKSNTGALIGVVDESTWLTLLEADAKVTRLEGDSYNEATDTVHDTVKAGSDHHRARLEARRDSLAAKLAQVEAQLA